MNEILEKIDWEKSPLLPAIAQDYESKDVLMLAYMNREALELTLKTKIAHYYSRSRKRIWKKGESSGNIQRVKNIYIDCDNDTILLKVEQVGGAACHTGRYSCFFTELESGEEVYEVDESKIASYSIVDRVYHTILERKKASSEKSYVASLFQKGENAILKKVVEEAGEFCFAVKDSKEEEIIYEACDLLFHSLVALGYKNISPELVKEELKRRFGISGIEEKKSRNK
ncbi:MAG: bifunctional phosphoribosyl-AMP cyclohydrolase/phosphoribosyl-ATP diphosphatase HisIE [Epsilonproteobacteria bacterium]|nr:bifunctional phosphoribosyl-AMP cyclohydrolase/phosphoribosyl-ATP diphosphatase HisIE [Campylobacterota bacterium]